MPDLEAEKNKWISNNDDKLILHQKAVVIDTEKIISSFISFYMWELTHLNCVLRNLHIDWKPNIRKYICENLAHTSLHQNTEKKQLPTIKEKKHIKCWKFRKASSTTAVRFYMHITVINPSTRLQFSTSHTNPQQVSNPPKAWVGDLIAQSRLTCGCSYCCKLVTLLQRSPAR